MSSSTLTYLILASIECGVYLSNGVYFIVTPNKGRRYRSYMATMCFILFLGMVLDVILAANPQLYDSHPELHEINDTTYFFMIPAAAGIFLSITMPHKSNWWLIKLILLSEIGPTLSCIVQCIWPSPTTSTINWIITIMYCIVIFSVGYVAQKRYEKAIKFTYSNTENLSTTWIYRIIMLFVIVFLYYWIALIINDTIHMTIGTILDTVVCLTICYYIDIQKPVSQFTTEIVTQLDSKNDNGLSNIPVEVVPDESGREGDRKEPVVRYSTIARKLQKGFVEKNMYLNQDITSMDVASAIGTNSRYLSYFLNNVMGKNFHTYVTELRAEYAKHLLEDNPNMDMDDVAYKSGFNTLGSLNKAFKGIYGTTPNKYRQNYLSRPEEERQPVAGQPDVAGENTTVEEVYKSKKVSPADDKVPAATTAPTKLATTDSFAGLNAREKSLCKLIRQGKSNREIAEEMNISVESLRVTKSRILRKLDPEHQFHDLKKFLSNA